MNYLSVEPKKYIFLSMLSCIRWRADLLLICPVLKKEYM